MTLQRDTQQTRPPGTHVKVRGVGFGLPWAVAGMLLGAAGAWRVVSLLPTVLSSTLSCDEGADLAIDAIRGGLIAAAAAGVLTVVLCEVAARRHLGKLRIVSAIGSVLGVFATLSAVALFVLTLLPDLANCIEGVPTA